MIDHIKFRTETNSKGVVFDQATLWVAGMNFTADLDEHKERCLRRVAKEYDCEILDLRKTKLDTSA